MKIYNKEQTLQVGDELAHNVTEDKVAQDGTDEGEGHAEHAEQQVGDGQVQQEQVGDGPHTLVDYQGQYDQAVAEDGQQKDGGVQQDLRLPPEGAAGLVCC